MHKASSILLAFVLPAALSVGSAMSGCASIDASVSASGTSNPAQLVDTDADTADGGTTAMVATDAGVRNTTPYTGSPLCHATSSSPCYPDLDTDPAAADAAVTSDGGVTAMCPVSAGATDGGVSTGSDGASGYGVACRVRASGDQSGTIAPVCSASGDGTDGAKCNTGADCGAGFDCVGDGVCRRYCCSGDCSEKSNGSKTFCDIVTLHEATSTLVPACVVVQNCQLLDDTSCPKDQTCSIVKDDGTTSCVAIGNAVPGDSCDEEHCAAGSVCLGQSGARRCFQLCQTADGQCPTSTSCKANALSPTPSIGICQPDM